jgi:hypothetical protein
MEITATFKAKCPSLTLHRAGEVVLGSAVALLVTWCMSKIWPPPVAERKPDIHSSWTRNDFPPQLPAIFAADGTWSASRFVVPRAWAQTEADMLTIRSDEDIDRILPSLTNWGRWGRRISSAP